VKLDGLEGRVAIITGSARGIGRATADVFCENGAIVVINDIDDLLLSQAEGEMVDRGFRVASVKADVSSRDGAASLVSETINRFGRLDILINNAGIIQWSRFEEISETDWDKMLAVNLKSVFLMSHSCVPYLKKQGGGKIVNIGSSAGKKPTPACPHYAASKSGVMSLTLSLAAELAPFNINVNAVAPAIIDTQMFESVEKPEKLVPLRRMGSPEDVAYAVAFLCSDNASFLTGEIVDVNGGLIMD